MTECHEFNKSRVQFSRGEEEEEGYSEGDYCRAMIMIKAQFVVR